MNQKLLWKNPGQILTNDEDDELKSRPAISMASSNSVDVISRVKLFNVLIFICEILAMQIMKQVYVVVCRKSALWPSIWWDSRNNIIQ